jgi:hypothetical protein
MGTPATVFAILFSLAASAAAADTWQVVKGMDNLADLRGCCKFGLNISELQAACLADRWCAGFSSHFGALKFSSASLQPQANTDFYIRVPPPPPLPPPAPNFVWPRPQYLTNGSSVVALGPVSDFFAAAGESFPLLLQVFARYVVLLQKIRRVAAAAAPNVPAVVGCDVFVGSANETLVSGVDESYHLTVPVGGRCSVAAQTVWGAMRALETFLGAWYSTDATFALAPLVVTDKPRYAHRGLMVDTARHYLPVEVLLAHLEGMSAAKLNVMHWHIIDQQAWPLNLTSLPRAAQFGSYSPAHATYSRYETLCTTTLSGSHRIAESLLMVSSLRVTLCIGGLCSFGIARFRLLA